MSKKKPTFRAGLVIGVLAGVLVTGGLAHSGMGRKAWDGFGRWFKAGYVLGYLDAVRLSKQTDPFGYIATTYELPKGAPWPKWVAEIDRMYAEPKYEKLDVGSLISLAGPILVKEHGLEPGSDPLAGLEKLKAAIKGAKKAPKASPTERAQSANSGGEEPDAAPEAAPEEGGGAPDADPKSEEPAED